MLPVISRQTFGANIEGFGDWRLRVLNAEKWGFGTNVALLAVKSIDSNALTNPTYLAVRAVIYIFRAVIIVKLAHVAVIVCQTAATCSLGRAPVCH